MDSGSMEIKVMYCKDVSSFNFFQKLLVYVLVSIVRNDGDPHKKPLELQKQQRRTPTDKEAEGDPEWNHPMHFDLTEVSFQDRDNLFVHFDLCHEGLYFGDKIIGEVRVPLKDLIQEANGIVRFVSYEVRTPDGKPNGMLNFSCKVKNMGTDSSQTGITGYPIVNHQPYPTSEVQSVPEQVHYPTLDLEANAPETRTVSQAPYTSDWTQYSSQENYNPPPEAYYHPPPHHHHQKPVIIIHHHHHKPVVIHHHHHHQKPVIIIHHHHHQKPIIIRRRQWWMGHGDVTAHLGLHRSIPGLLVLITIAVVGTGVPWQDSCRHLLTKRCGQMISDWGELTVHHARRNSLQPS
uniref:C2 domain-containing protein n=1 Tax=Salix viminalis TaxID=40686 RepID=A0A6N2MEB0_SALVM